MTWMVGRPRPLEGEVWSIDGVRHGVTQIIYEEHSCVWESLCGTYETAVTYDGGKPPHLFKGFVTCLQCLAREAEP